MNETEREQRLAKDLLAHKATGYSFGYLLRKSLGRYAIFAVVIVAVVVDFFTTADTARRLSWMFLLGLVVGAILRDYGWIRRNKRNWVFTARVVDWKTVETIAEGQGGQGNAAQDRGCRDASPSSGTTQWTRREDCRRL